MLIKKSDANTVYLRLTFKITDHFLRISYNSLPLIK